jgi:putative flippase GtrA
MVYVRLVDSGTVRTPLAHMHDAAAAPDTALEARPRAGALTWLIRPRLRPVRFLLVGGVTAGVQLALIALLLADRWPSLLGNAAALALAMQANFALSAVFTWLDRWHAPLPVGRWSAQAWWIAFSRYARFMGAAALTVALNETGYDVAQRYLPALLAAALCSAATSALNYVVVGRLVFRRTLPR